MTNSSVKSRLLASSSLNSSTMMINVGIGSMEAPAIRARSYSWSELCPALRSASCRRTSSPCSASCIRSTSGSSSARFVIIADVCGSASRPRKVAPPLKSTSTTLSTSGEWVIASASTSVRSNSLLPDPVAPISIPCGPIPPCADSLRSSSTGEPSSATPIGTRSRSQGLREAQAAGGSKVFGSPVPSSVVRLMSVLIGSVDSTEISTRCAASCRASARQRVTSRVSGCPSRVATSWPALSTPMVSTRSAVVARRRPSRSARQRSAPSPSPSPLMATATALRKPASASRAAWGTGTPSRITMT